MDNLECHPASSIDTSSFGPAKIMSTVTEVARKYCLEMKYQKQNLLESCFLCNSRILDSMLGSDFEELK